MAEPTKKQIAASLRSWDSLNGVMGKITKQVTLEQLLVLELTGRRRRTFLLRIHSRLNRVRAEAERKVLISKAKER